MKISSAVFLTSSLDLAGCPEPTLPEFSLIGRSNVGKSSLLNMLTNNGRLAKVSKTPGHTKLLNFFTINKTWRLVDLPGYGYAKVQRADQSRFNQAVADYLACRENMPCVFVLVDSSIPPQQMDLEFVHWLMQVAAPFALVFTKTDKITPTRLKKHVDEFCTEMAHFSENLPPILTCSSKSGDGQKEILDFVDQVLEGRKKNAAAPKSEEEE